MEKQFQKLCYEGKLEEVKELLDNPTINISAEIINNAFHSSCYYRQLNIAKLLLELKPDINKTGLTNDEYLNTILIGMDI
jgi:hypothetical protein